MVALTNTIPPGEQDIEFACINCKENFLWKKSEQEYYAKNGLYPPKRCKPCRLLKRAEMARNGETV